MSTPLGAPPKPLGIWHLVLGGAVSHFLQGAQLAPRLWGHPAPFPCPPTTETIPPNAAMTVTGNLFTADSANGKMFLPFSAACKATRDFPPGCLRAGLCQPAATRRERALPDSPPPSQHPPASGSASQLLWPNCPHTTPECPVPGSRRGSRDQWSISSFFRLAAGWGEGGHAGVERGGREKRICIHYLFIPPPPSIKRIPGG